MKTCKCSIQETEEVENRSVYRAHHCNPLRMDEVCGPPSKCLTPVSSASVS